MIAEGSQVMLHVGLGCPGEGVWHGYGPALTGHVGFVDVVDPTQGDDMEDHKVAVIVHGGYQWFRPSELRHLAGSAWEMPV